MSTSQETPPASARRSLRHAWSDWHAAWSRLSPNRKASNAILHVLFLAFAAGAFAVGVAVAHRLVASLAGRFVLDGLVGLVVIVSVVRDPLMPTGGDDPGFSPVFGHQAAAVLGFVLVCWTGFAGLAGVDLSTSVDFYAQLAQIIPVLLLAVAVERRFVPGGLDRPSEDERFVLRGGFVFLVVGPALAELLALLAIASHVRWIEVTATLLAAGAVPSLLVLLVTPLAIALYAPASVDTTT
jgi:hypothetical protein